MTMRGECVCIGAEVMHWRLYGGSSYFIRNMHIIDLTHEIDPLMPSWTGRPAFRFEVKMDYDEGVRVLKYSCHAGVGTHIDAPAHFFRDGKRVAEIPLEELMAPLCVIDVSAKRAPHLFIQPEDVVQYEERWGEIERGNFVCGYTSWDAYWHDATRYRNADASGKMRFPGFSKEAAELLVARGVSGIGIDTLSPDGSHDGFPVHEVILGSGKWIVENVAHLKSVPARGTTMGIFPMKIAVGTEAPVRCISFVFQNLDF